MMLKASLIGLAAALALTVCSDVAPSDGLRLATWNLEHLAASNGAGCRPRTEEDYAKLRSYAASLNADVIGLQEVENEAAAHRVFPSDTYDVVMSGQPYPAEQGSCGQVGGQVFTPQRTGIAIRKGIPYRVNPPLEALNVSGNPSRPVRWGVDITIEGDMPLRILNVHLKSGCASGANPSDEDCPILFRQVPVIETWVQARQAEQASFAIVGDFNRRLSASDAEVWQVWDDAASPERDLHLAAAEANAAPSSPRCDNAKYPDFIDHIAFSQSALDRVERGSFAELVFTETGDAMPSDHCPISIMLKQR